MDKHALIFELHKIGAIQFGEFILKSGLSSSFYVNLRKIISYPFLLRSIASIMWRKIKTDAPDVHFDLICGVPYTALPIATCIAVDHDLPMVMRRKEKKDYGTKQVIEGQFHEDQNCLIVEDIITTGVSILETANDLKEAKIKITDVIALIDREQGGKHHLAEHFRTHTVLNLSEIFAILLDSNVITNNERTQIEKLQAEKIMTC